MSGPVSLREWLRLLETRHPVAIDLGLERIAAVWDRLGRPRPAPRLITVAGTNGKGSTVAYAAALLEALGFATGTYTSPHLLRYNERIRVRGAEVDDAALLAAFERVEGARGAISLTYFEFGTLAAFLILAEAGLDYAVLEVGLGGRLDAVNVVDPDCAVITAVGLDHREYLGPDRESIGREKAGIIRPGRPVICAEAKPPRAVLEAARKAGAPLRRIGQDFTICRNPEGLRWSGPEGAVDLPLPAMPGVHQWANLAAAVAAVATLVAEALEKPEALASAIATVRVAGRLQMVYRSPRVLVDVGHNALAASAIAGALGELRTHASICVIGMLRDKDAGAVATELNRSVGIWHCCGLGGERGQTAAELAREVRVVSGAERVREFPDVGSGLNAALAAAGAGDAVLVFGSFHTASEALALLHGKTSC